jgi:hypothetical protein
MELECERMATPGRDPAFGAQRQKQSGLDEGDLGSRASLIEQATDFVSGRRASVRRIRRISSRVTVRQAVRVMPNDVVGDAGASRDFRNRDTGLEEHTHA